MTEEIVLGISACLHGENVRYDASSKTSAFCVNDLAQHVTFKPFCPEVAIGLPIPRPSIRQIKKNDLIHIARPDGSGDVTAALQAYGKTVASQTQHISGFVFCAKSPTCGMERVKVYNENGDALPANGVGAFAKEIMAANPLLPCEENGRLNDAILRENFVARVFVYKSWQRLTHDPMTKHALTNFHSKHKYMVMSHDLVAYKQLGRLLAHADMPVEDMAQEYIHGLMTALKKKATRKKHANTLQHIQGYFSKYLSSNERQELANKIDDYRLGLVPLMAPLTLIKHYQMHYPDDYLAQQTYLHPYPEELRLRYGY